MSHLESKARGMVFATRLLLLAVFVTLAACLPMRPQETTNDEEELTRFRRKIGHLNITSTPREYIRTLFDDYAYEDGKPRYGADRPTDVWCFPDKGEYLDSL